MRRVVLALALSCGLLAGCGGGHSHHPRPGAGAPPPVAIQLRAALRGALHAPRGIGQVAPQLPVVQRPQLPYVAVEQCRGPRAGGPGTYFCTTRPRRRHGVSTLIVDVTAAGTWTTRQLTVRSTGRGRGATGAQAVFGFGIRFPR